jgi:hypothetical protein
VKTVMLALRVCGLAVMLLFGVVLLRVFTTLHSTPDYIDAVVFISFAAAIMMLIFCVYSLIFIGKSGTKFELVGLGLLVVTTVLYWLMARNSLSFLRSPGYFYPLVEKDFLETVVAFRDVIYFVSVVLILLPNLHRFFKKRLKFND